MLVRLIVKLSQSLAWPFIINIEGILFCTQRPFSFQISSMVSDVQLAAIVCTSVSVTLFLVGGFLVNISHIPWAFRWLTYISPFTWSFVGLVINQFEGEKSRFSESDLNRLFFLEGLGAELR
jgi:ABC-type multidrug transport system permease subunit